MMDYSDYDNPQWDVDRVKLEFRTGKQARMLCQSRHISLLSSSTDATEMRSGLLLRTRLCGVRSRLNWNVVKEGALKLFPFQ